MRRTSTLLFAFVFLYAVLWALTGHYGNAIVRAAVCDELHREWHTEVAGRKELSSLPRSAYYCHSQAVAPFVVSLDFGYECGPVCGHGAGGFVLWLPGANAPFYQRSWWAS